MTGKAEQEDYASFAGFMAYYLYGLYASEEWNRLTPIPSMDDELGIEPSTPTTSGALIQLILGGYSYGSLVLARLPTMSTVMQRIELADEGTTGARIALRARTLAKQTKQSFEELHSPTSHRGRQLRPGDATTSPTKRIEASPITVGGEETDASARRRSRDSRRSMDLVRKSVELPRRIRAHLSHSSTPQTASESEKGDASPLSPAQNDLPVITTCYLVISPVLLPFTHTI